MLRVDLHLHSNYSHDGRSTLQQLIDRAAECALDRIALTDHNVFEGAESLRRMAPALAIGGEEIKKLQSEGIGLFITRRGGPLFWARGSPGPSFRVGGMENHPPPPQRNPPPLLG